MRKIFIYCSILHHFSRFQRFGPTKERALRRATRRDATPFSSFEFPRLYRIRGVGIPDSRSPRFHLRQYYPRVTLSTRSPFTQAHCRIDGGDSSPNRFLRFRSRATGRMLCHDNHSPRGEPESLGGCGVDGECRLFSLSQNRSGLISIRIENGLLISMSEA